jgi:hypothetical protein
MQRTYTQADEKAILIGLSYDFAGLGIDGLSAIANLAYSWDGEVAGVRGDVLEFNVTLDYRIGGGWLESFWLRVRGAWIDDEAAGANGTDVRVILRYDLPVI